MGSVIKFISGNLDQDDLGTIQKQLDSLKRRRTEEIRHVNRLISFSNSIVQKFYDEINRVNLNMGIVKIMLEKEGFEISILEHLQYVSMCLQKLYKVIQTIENTISFSFDDTTNVNLFSPSDLENIVNHLRSIYPEKSIIHTDPYHLYENLKFSKTQVVSHSGE